MRFKHRLFISFSGIFTVYTLLVMIFQYEREKTFKDQSAGEHSGQYHRNGS